MVVTEKIARTKWCPHVRVAGSTTAYNRYDSSAPLASCRCMASDCMMWTEWSNVGEKTGYCGLTLK